MPPQRSPLSSKEPDGNTSYFEQELNSVLHNVLEQCHLIRLHTNPQRGLKPKASISHLLMELMKIGIIKTAQDLSVV